MSINGIVGNELRKNLPPLPARVQQLPVNEKGYPIPWFVETLADGTRDFRIMSAVKLHLAIKRDLCWICGDKLGRTKVFVIGPMCAVNRTSAELPAHADCARFSAISCPFLTLPKAIRREAGLPPEAGSPHGEASLKRNPGVALLWFTRGYKVLRVPTGILFRIGEPEAVEWYCEGRTATRAEVQASVTSGLPFLEKIAMAEGALPELMAQVAKAEVLYPS